MEKSHYRLVKVEKRPSKDEYYLDIARKVAMRSTCMRRNYGAVLVKNDEIIATGYNGAPRGDENCCDVGSCWRERHGIPHGEQYEKCVAVHAEMNCIVSAARDEMIGSKLYLAGFEVVNEGENSTRKPLFRPEPCKICSKLIKNAGIEKVVS